MMVPNVAQVEPVYVDGAGRIWPGRPNQNEPGPVSLPVHGLAPWVSPARRALLARHVVWVAPDRVQLGCELSARPGFHIEQRPQHERVS
jgi:hypothetical protein